MNIVFACMLQRIIYFLRSVIFFLGPGMLYHYLKKIQTWKRLEQYVEDNGIKRELTSSPDDFGELHWESQGRPVTVRICHDNPSFGPWISVGLKLNTQILRVHTYKPMKRPSSGWEAFISPSPEFNYLYKTRHVRSDYSEKLLNSLTIFDDIVKFYYDWILYLSNDIGTNGLVVDGEEVRFCFGPSAIRSMFPYVTPEEIEAVLPDMIELAEKFDLIFLPEGEC